MTSIATSTNTNNNKVFNEPLPHPTKEHIDNCHSHMVHQDIKILKKCTIRSIIIPRQTELNI